MPYRFCALLSSSSHRTFSLWLALAASGGLFGASFPAYAQATGPTIAVDASADKHPISALVYGMNLISRPDNQADVALAKSIRLAISRWGGDATTRYNWQVDASNAGDDFYFLAGSGTPSGVPSGSADKFVEFNRAVGSQTLLTIPIIDYVNKSARFDCSFPVSIFGPQQKVNPYVHPVVNGQPTDAGNGRTPDGKEITLTRDDILRVHVPNTTLLQKGWLQHLISRFGTAAKGGVAIYELDNEPGGWSNTHHDVHPQTPTYPEIIAKSIPYAAMIKAADPTAAVLGPGDFGWAVYKGDLDKQNGLWNAELYLQKMAAYQKLHGVRILDYLDEHYYPTAQADWTDAVRLESTRSLWDSTYVEKDWIGQYSGAINLIPRMHQWVDKYYPGTKLAITEYSWGNFETLNGALIQADVLGIFGRERLDLATLFGTPKATDPLAYAFRLYRNYDGKGGKYGETWVRSVSADQGKLAVYGALRAEDSALTLVLINKTSEALTSDLKLANFHAAGAASIFRYDASNLKAIVRQPDQAVGAQGFRATYPAQSITLVVIPKQA